ncbi:FadR/GntR family transcriptional regulator [Desulfosarcina ovata]|uniref:GntR family transcriptional regulator n=1 Tax=Desulfosarcina ovata subsp. ovata TaxID=2752305 RepID=A0A5K8A6Y9_9BACT|nr:FadR/GntR family transcriptional regulator [Desulfosarcina ovata]BBO88216.1 GntR family transcriptional regulator [Desulfosarcina ovata subsp. ovata]
MGFFIPIKTSRASEDVFSQLKGAILSGKFQSGSKLPSERELTAEFQVSRGVIREAIRMLELSGFLAIRQGHGGGAYVTDLTLSHVGNAFLDLFQTNTLSMAEVSQVRLFIEPEVARLAALSFNPSHLKRIEEAEAGEYIEFKSLTDRIARLTAVHKVLADICGNLFFEAIVRSILKITAEVVMNAVPDPDSLHGPGDHRAVIDAVKAGDAPRAAAEMALHLRGFSTTIVELEKVYRRKIARE